MRILLACEHAHKHIVCPLVSLEHKLIQHVLPSFLLDLGLEEHHEIVVGLLVAQIRFISLGVMQIIDNLLVERDGRTLI